MEFLDVVRSRKTTNGHFLPTPVSEAHQRLLMEVAGRAPSQLNSQPWRFVLIESRDTIEKIAAISGESMTTAMSNGTFFERYKRYFRFSEEEMEKRRDGMLFDKLPALLRPFTKQVFTKRGQKVINAARIPQTLGEENRKLVAGCATADRRAARPGREPARRAVVLLLDVQHGRRDGERVADHRRGRHGNPVRLIPHGGAGQLGTHRAAARGSRLARPDGGVSTRLPAARERRPAIDWSSHQRKRPSQYVFQDTCATPREGWDSPPDAPLA